MRVIIAGSREIADYSLVERAVRDSCFEITEVVSGCAPGVDRLGEEWAEENDIPIKQFPADWKRYRDSAGPIRNKQMSQYGEALIAIWDGKSPGTRNMIQLAKDRNLKIHIHRL